MKRYYVIKDCEGSIYLITGGDWDGNWDVIDTQGNAACTALSSLEDFPIFWKPNFETLDEALENRFEKGNAEILGKMSIKEFVNTYVSE